MKNFETKRTEVEKFTKHLRRRVDLLEIHEAEDYRPSSSNEDDVEAYIHKYGLRNGLRGERNVRSQLYSTREDSCPNKVVKYRYIFEDDFEYSSGLVLKECPILIVFECVIFNRRIDIRFRISVNTDIDYYGLFEFDGPAIPTIDILFTQPSFMVRTLAHELTHYHQKLYHCSLASQHIEQTAEAVMEIAYVSSVVVEHLEAILHNHNIFTQYNVKEAIYEARFPVARVAVVDSSLVVKEHIVGVSYNDDGVVRVTPPDYVKSEEY